MGRIILWKVATISNYTGVIPNLPKIIGLKPRPLAERRAAMVARLSMLKPRRDIRSCVSNTGNRGYLSQLICVESI